MIKPHILFLVLVTLVLTSCEKDQVGTAHQTLIGKWEWTRSVGGFAGQILTPANTGVNRSMEISRNKIKYFANDTLVSETGYELKMMYSNMVGRDEKVLMLVLKNGYVNQRVKVSKDRLLLSDECYDCYETEYVKK
ncbi:MAG: hypothetical protein H3C36_08200 [Chitinophagaceae bacterium]|nr:hypothetical protein [Chitinophagaceae bacterium]